MWSDVCVDTHTVCHSSHTQCVKSGGSSARGAMRLPSHEMEHTVPDGTHTQCVPDGTHTQCVPSKHVKEEEPGIEPGTSENQPAYGNRSRQDIAILST